MSICINQTIPLGTCSDRRDPVVQISGKNQRLIIDRKMPAPVASLSIANVVCRGRMSLTFFRPALPY